MIALIVKRFLGAIALLFGGILIVWFLYNQIWPTESFRRNYTNIFQLAVPIAMLIVGWKWIRFEGKGIEEVVPPDWSGPELARATEKAKSSLSEFISRVENGEDQAYIKFPFHTPQGLTEHIWGYVHFHKDAVFNVSLANAPIDEKAEVTGRKSVSISDVEDWQIMQADGQIEGAFSLIALFEYWQGQGNALSPKMKKQKALLVNL